MSFANAPWHDDCDRIAIGPLGFTFEHPAANPAQYPGYWLSGQHLYRNGKLYGTAVRYWFDRDSLAWYADYRRLPAAAQRPRMDVTEVTQAVQAIEAVGDRDPETAHTLEDGLYRKVLKEIAGGNPSSPELAKAALDSQAVEFPRWCA